MSYLQKNIGGTFPTLQGLQLILLIFRKVMGQQCNEITRTIMIKIFHPLAGIFKKSKKTGTGKPCAVSHYYSIINSSYIITKKCPQIVTFNHLTVKFLVTFPKTSTTKELLGELENNYGLFTYIIIQPTFPQSLKKSNSISGL